MKKELTKTKYDIEKVFEGAQDFLPLLGTDYIEFYVTLNKQLISIKLLLGFSHWPMQA